jgi:serine/threonine-protein kinase
VPIEQHLPGLPEALARTIDRALKYNASERFRNVLELRDALLRFTDTADQPAPVQARQFAPPRVCLDCGQLQPLVGPRTAARFWLCRNCLEQTADFSFPGYRFLRKFEFDGLTTTYLAVNEADGSPVAVKTVEEERRESGDVLVAHQEAVLRQLRHPGILPIRGSGEAHGLPYFTMDVVEGMSAQAILDNQGPLPVGRAAAWLVQVLDVLAYLHGRGLIHRNVKPRHLLVSRREGREVVHLTGFELVMDFHGPPPTPGPAGTPPLMPPEQWRDEGLSPRSDLFTAAGALYSLLTGKLPFTRKSTEEGPVPIRSRRADLPDGLVALIDRALALDPADRFPDAPAMRQALLPFVEYR